MDVKNFPEALRLSRKLMDWSQEQVAVEVGASQQTVAGWEKGRSNPRPDAYAKLVEVFGAESLVAKFPPKDEDLASEVLTRTRFNVPARVAHARAQGSNPPNPAPPDQRALSNKLRQSLPEKYWHGLGQSLTYRNTSYYATYQSETICLMAIAYRLPTLAPLKGESADRIRSLFRVATRRAAHDAIHQLVVLRAINALQGSDGRAYVAAVLPAADMMLGFDGLLPTQVEDEAYLLGLRCYHAVSLDSIASIIVGHETWLQDSESLNDYFDDFIDGQAP